MLAALQPQLGILPEHPVPRDDTPLHELEDDAAAAFGRLERERKRGTVPASALDPLQLRELLCPRLRLAGSRSGAEARDEPLQALDLGLLALDGTAQGEFAGGALAPPCVPRSREEPPAPGRQLQHRRAH